MLLFVVQGGEKPLGRVLDILGGAVDDFGEPDGQAVELRQAARHIVVARFVGDQVVKAAAGKRGYVFRQGLAGLGTGDLDLVILENVGNLVCPAEFDTGAVKNAMILSVPEGHDKPLKYPLMFQVCDVVLVNKIDVLPYFDFDMDKCREYVALRNPNAKVIPICARTGEGIDEWADWLKEQVKAWQA